MLIAAERYAKPVSELLTTLGEVHGETDIVLSSITVIELEHGLHRANAAELARMVPFADLLIGIPPCTSATPLRPETCATSR